MLLSDAEGNMFSTVTVRHWTTRRGRRPYACKYVRCTEPERSWM